VGRGNEFPEIPELVRRCKGVVAVMTQELKICLERRTGKERTLTFLNQERMFDG
jgi:hypothetical protein